MSSSPFVDKAETLSRTLCRYMTEPDARAAQEDIVAAYRDFAGRTSERLALGEAHVGNEQAVVDFYRRANASFDRHRARLDAHFPPSVAEYYTDRIAAEADAAERLTRPSPAPAYTQVGFTLYDHSEPLRAIVPGSRRIYPPHHMLGSMGCITPGNFFGMGLIRVEELASDQRRDLAESIFSSFDRFYAAHRRQHDDAVQNWPKFGRWSKKISADGSTGMDRALKRGHAAQLHIHHELQDAFGRNGASGQDAKLLADKVWQRCSNIFGDGHDSRFFTGQGHAFGEYVRPEPYMETSFPKGRVVPIVRPASTERSR